VEFAWRQGSDVGKTGDPGEIVVVEPRVFLTIPLVAHFRSLMGAVYR
jgi:hypothetical protein